MAQVTDYTVSNQTFPNTRADINNIFAAIATNNSGTSAPSNQQAGQWWIDTTSSTWVLYIHDGTDDIQFATIDTSANTVNFIDSALSVQTDPNPTLGGDLDLNSNDITGTGNINITGNITATQISIGDSHIILDDVNDNLEINSSTDEDIKINSARNIGNDLDHTSAGGTRSFQVTSQGESKTHLFLTTDGDFSLYEDTGTTAKLFWDASAESLGIGTDSPTKKIDISGNNGGGGQTNTLRFTDTDTSSASNQTTGRIEFYTSDSDGAGVGSAITGLSGTTGIGNSELTFEVAGSERMRIDSSGNLMVGKTSTSLVAGFSVLGGVNAGTLQVRRDIATANSASVGYISRGTSDGSILNFYKNDSLVGSIGTTSSRLYIGTGDTALFFDDVNNAITPRNATTGGAVADTIDLGIGAGRFKDLYLSGNIYLGGTGSANALDDYESGTWTPTYVSSSGSFSSVTYDSEVRGFYTKIGKLVVAQGFIMTDAISVGTASGDVLIGGLPFTVKIEDNQVDTGAGVIGNSADFGGDNPSSAYPTRNTTTAYLFYRTTSNGVSLTLNVSDLGTGANDNQMRFSIIYRAD